MEKVKNIISNVYNSVPNIKSLPENSHIANAFNMADQTPIIKDVYRKKFNPVSRTFLESKFINDETKISLAKKPLSKMAIKSVRGVGQLNSYYNNLMETPDAKKVYNDYNMNFGGKKKIFKKHKKTKTKRKKIRRRRYTKKNI